MIETATSEMPTIASRFDQATIAAFCPRRNASRWRIVGAIRQIVAAVAASSAAR